MCWICVSCTKVHFLLQKYCSVLQCRSPIGLAGGLVNSICGYSCWSRHEQAKPNVTLIEKNVLRWNDLSFKINILLILFDTNRILPVRLLQDLCTHQQQVIGCWIRSTWPGGTATVQTWLHRPHLWSAEMMLPKERDSLPHWSTLYPWHLWSKPNTEKKRALLFFAMFGGIVRSPFWRVWELVWFSDDFHWLIDDTIEMTPNLV